VPFEDVVGSVELVTIYTPPEPLSGTDLDFNPAQPGELWAIFRQLGFQGAPCNETNTDPQACALLEGLVAVISAADGAGPNGEIKVDANSWHFMRRPPAIAFGDDDTFATCGEHRTGNFDDNLADFMGPTLWSADPVIFGPDGPGGNGSHLDMLHATPFGMGIAHERGNAYWVFNGDAGALDRYDFRAPHVPGGEDHSDGEATRYVLGELAREPGVPSHLEYDPRDGSVYVADTGNGRVVRVDSTSGMPGEPLICDDIQLGNTVAQVVDSTVEVIVPAGVLEQPSGLALSGDVLFVTDSATSRIVAFSLDGEELGAFDTGLPPGTLAGIVVGPDGRAYISDLSTGVVRRIEPR
jgi:hypothetical protein